jgi:hypothetical protein
MEAGLSLLRFSMRWEGLRVAASHNQESLRGEGLKMARWISLKSKVSRIWSKRKQTPSAGKR